MILSVVLQMHGSPGTCWHFLLGILELVNTAHVVGRGLAVSLITVVPILVSSSLSLFGYSGSQGGLNICNRMSVTLLFGWFGGTVGRTSACGPESLVSAVPRVWRPLVLAAPWVSVPWVLEPWVLMPWVLVPWVLAVPWGLAIWSIFFCFTMWWRLFLMFLDGANLVLEKVGYHFYDVVN